MDATVEIKWKATPEAERLFAIRESKTKGDVGVISDLELREWKPDFGRIATRDSTYSVNLGQRPYGNT
jgi:hypothetical protein